MDVANCEIGTGMPDAGLFGIHVVAEADDVGQLVLIGGDDAESMTEERPGLILCGVIFRRARRHTRRTGMASSSSAVRRSDPGVKGTTTPT